MGLLFSGGRGMVMLNKSTTKIDVAQPIVLDVGSDETPLEALNKYVSKIYKKPDGGWYYKDEEIKWRLTLVDKTVHSEIYFYCYESTYLSEGYFKETGRVHNWYQTDALPYDADPLLHFGVNLAKRGGSYILTQAAA